MSKKERIVAAIENGTVIDHIPSEKTYEVANLLKVHELDTPVTIGSNYISKKLGKKGIIKVEDKYFSDADRRYYAVCEVHCKHLCDQLRVRWRNE